MGVHGTVLWWMPHFFMIVLPLGSFLLDIMCLGVNTAAGLYYDSQKLLLSTYTFSGETEGFPFPSYQGEQHWSSHHHHHVCSV